METLYNLIYWIDKRFFGIEEYNDETAPYCGHAYYGHTGTLTKSHYTEVGGGAEHKNWLFEITYHDEEGWGFQFSPIIIGDRKKGRCFELFVGSRFTLKPSLHKRNLSHRTIIDFSWLGLHPTYYGKRIK